MPWFKKSESLEKAILFPFALRLGYWLTRVEGVEKVMRMTEQPVTARTSPRPNIVSNAGIRSLAPAFIANRGGNAFMLLSFSMKDQRRITGRLSSLPVHVQAIVAADRQFILDILPTEHA
jgi:hypothetical protein